LDRVVTGSCRVTAKDAARGLLGMVARSEAVPVTVLQEFARAVLEADPIAKLALWVMDDSEAHRLARAIELAGVVLDADAKGAAFGKSGGKAETEAVSSA
jgi:hypothetical protein